MGDSALVLSWLAKTRDVDLERGLTPLDRAQGLALRVLLEEHWHQIFEYELILHEAGAGARLGAAMQEHFRGHLYERGMLRHTPEEITAFGKQDLDAVAAWLDGRTWVVADRPTLTDCTVWGLLAPAVFAPFQTPCMSYARTLAPLVDFVERSRARFFRAGANLGRGLGVISRLRAGQLRVGRASAGRFGERGVGGPHEVGREAGRRGVPSGSDPGRSRGPARSRAGAGRRKTRTGRPRR